MFVILLLVPDHPISTFYMQLLFGWPVNLYGSRQQVLNISKQKKLEFSNRVGTIVHDINHSKTLLLH